MFKDWDSFFLLVGGAAGALIGLLFIVVTLMQGGDGRLKLKAVAVYMTPTVAHLSMVLALSALATAPGVPMVGVGWVFGGCTLVCLGFTGRALLMFANGSIKAAHWTDLWAYGIAPFAVCLLLAASVGAVCLAPQWAPRGIAASLIALLLLAIRNAWDLVTWITVKGDTINTPET